MARLPAEGGCAGWAPQVRFLWALPAVMIYVAGMTEVAGDVCQGPGLARLPLRTCTAATLTFQVHPPGCRISTLLE